VSLDVVDLDMDRNEDPNEVSDDTKKIRRKKISNKKKSNNKQQKKQNEKS